MTTDENILMEMFERVTNPISNDVDNYAVRMFCMIVQSKNELVTKAHRLMVGKMHSRNTTEAVRAIGLLEECMSKGGLEFQKKTAKFNFLNELIALVLDKHPGAPVPVETKKRIMECLMLWTVEHKDKSKIQEAYNNLKKEVNFTSSSSGANSNSADIANFREQRPSILGKDDQLVAKLLKQGGEENYKKANFLIQQRVNQEASRTEFICHLKSEMKKVASTMELLDEMLNSYSSDAPDTENRDIIKELYNNCKGYHEQMARWPDFLADTEPEFLEDVLNTKDLLSDIIQRYKETFDKEKEFTTSTKSNTSTTNTDLLTELLGDTLITCNSNPSESNIPVKANDTIYELNEIFGSVIDNVEEKKPQHPSELLGDLDLLKPISVFEIIDKPASTVSSIAMSNGKEERKGQGFKELKEIDKLSDEIFKKNLNKDRLLSFKKETEKLTLNDMAKDRIETSLIASKVSEINIKTPLKSKGGTTILSRGFKENEENSLNTESQENELKIKDLGDKRKSDDPCLTILKPLAEISVDLDDVTPLDESQRLLLDDDIQVTLNFTADRPSEHVSVIVMTVTNKSKLPVKDFQFEASVKKPCKVRLLPPTDIVMAPMKPFRPSTPINQIVLLSNPTQKSVDITCIIGYKLGDDPDPIKESVVTKDIPYV